MGATHFSGVVCGAIELTAAAVSLTELDHSGRPIVLDKADGQVLTLPKATGSGAKFPLFVKTTVTSNLVIQVANADDIMQGSAIVDGTTSTMFQTAADSDTATLNGTTTGGVAGSQIEIEDVAAGIFRVSAVLNGSGTEATPFSAAVS